MTRREASRWLAWLGLSVLVLLAWWNSLHGEFTYDDKIEVVGNRTIRFLSEWKVVIAYNWSRPVTLLSYAANFAFSRFEPFWYHAVDVALHAAASGLAMLFVAELAEARGHARPLRVGFAAALLWALHPLQTESVSYVTGRSEQLCALFYLVSCWAWIRFARHGGWHRAALSMLGLALAFFTKEVAATLPVALGLIELFALRGGALRELRWRRYAPWLLALAAFFALRYRVYGTFTARGEVERALAVQVFTQAEVILRYLQLAVLPWGQSIFHDHPETGLSLRSALAAAALVGATGLAWMRRKQVPELAFGWIWFLLILMPSSSVVPLKETMAEHRVHLSLLGLAWMAGFGLDRLEGRRFTAALTAIALLFGGLTARRNQLWSTEVTLWGDAVAQNPDSAEAWYGYGDALRLKKRLPEALTAYRRSVELNPDLRDGWNNLGLVQATMGDAREAEATWRAVLKRSPTYCKAHNNLGLLRALEGRYEEAGAELRTTLAYCPEDCMAHRLLGELYGKHLNDREKALLHLEFFLDACPADEMSDEVRKLRDDLTW